MRLPYYLFFVISWDSFCIIILGNFFCLTVFVYNKSSDISLEDWDNLLLPLAYVNYFILISTEYGNSRG